MHAAASMEATFPRLDQNIASSRRHEHPFEMLLLHQNLPKDVTPAADAALGTTPKTTE